MYTLTLSADELATLSALAPRIASKAKPVKPKAPRKATPIPAYIIAMGDQWKALCKSREGDSDDAVAWRQRDNVTLRDVIALHSGLPEVRA